ncbi:nucleotidyltransferase domain-containing protein [Pseudomonas nitroreducens]|uniref:nucleotidyltransferase domain-containing protein n=1 Tax=Pseudomonas nitroreducens TaxID=46680 RepID=UPI003817EB6F
MSKLLYIDAVFGFGSFFRSEKYNDIDLAIIINCPREQQLENLNKIIDTSRSLSKEINIPIDITPFTRAEFAENPLREMSSLVTIYLRRTNNQPQTK